MQLILLIFGICALGYYGYSLANQYVYQAYQNWAFDQQIAGRRGVTFADYLRERTPFGFLVGTKTTRPEITAPPSTASSIAPPANGSLLGRLQISRLNLAAMVREGVDAKTLSVAVGHVPSTSLPGQPGNFAIAAHRDTLFRALKDIRTGDQVTFQSPGGTYTYEVAATKIVKPSDVSVLRSDGGGLIPGAEQTSGKDPSDKLLTMITCYPFYYVGSAPKRFIVEAKLVSSDSDAKLAESVAPTALAPESNRTPVKHRITRNRTSPRTGKPHLRHSANIETTTAAPETAPKKRGSVLKMQV